LSLYLVNFNGRILPHFHLNEKRIDLARIP
jgi:hypothetical protein